MALLTASRRPAPPRSAPFSPSSAGALVVYCVPTAAFSGPPDRLNQLLLPDEQQRAARYARLADRLRFQVGRASLRHLLGQQLGLPPAAVPLRLSPLGKPELAGSAGPNNVHFNVAHSGEWVLLALAAHPVGIDVEEQNPTLDFADVAAHRFGPAERQRLAQSAQPVATFYQLWTQLEARAKAAGLGLSAETDPAGWTVAASAWPPATPPPWPTPPTGSRSSNFAASTRSSFFEDGAPAKNPSGGRKAARRVLCGC